MSTEIDEAIRKEICENIIPVIDDIISELDVIEFTPEMEENARKMSCLSVEEMLRPFTI